MRVAYASMFSITWAGSGYFFPLSGIELTTRVYTHTHTIVRLCVILFSVRVLSKSTGLLRHSTGSKPSEAAPRLTAVSVAGLVRSGGSGILKLFDDDNTHEESS